jgi:hypothetical protein
MKRLLFMFVILAVLLLACGGAGERPAPTCYKVKATDRDRNLSWCVEWHRLSGDYLTFLPCGGATADIEIHNVAGMSIQRGEECGTSES